MIYSRHQLYCLSIATRPIWFGCDGSCRIAHSDDMRQMLDDLGILERA